MPNGATTARRLADMTREKRRIYEQTHNAIWKKKGAMKMYRCIDTEILAGGKA